MAEYLIRDSLIDIEDIDGVGDSHSEHRVEWQEEKKRFETLVEEVFDEVFGSQIHGILKIHDG